MPHRRGEGGRWTSLHESTSVCPPFLISSQPHAQTLPLTYSALSLCSLHFQHTHTHTQAQDHYLALPILTSTRTLYIFFCTIHTSCTRSLSSWTSTLSKSLHSVQ